MRANLAILLSGRGSNAGALIKACTERDFPARVSVVASDVAGAPGLDIARAADIPVEVVDRRAYQGRAAFETALLTALRAYPVDLVCLAGFMRVLGPTFIEAWPPGRILNIHPSLLPQYKGLDTHARALADGATEHGCTVHIVTAELDSGPVLLQRRVPVEAGDTPETLAARVLQEEHIAYVEAVRAAAECLLKEGAI